MTITETKYNAITGNISCKTDTGYLEINAKNALEIAYALFDWAGLDYEILDKLSQKVEGECG